ncbi:hypothetical protein ANANG_G00299180 [Anguilla anguilla]|uniref:Uncharacterized protein n=1 Tax=Anguilla anguilla TaxID=7936 RepID=A0A9D3LL99_ANGAN|nr:hypothetical protein ANANG_G00299180 [Anguilla anguilla]
MVSESALPGEGERGRGAPRRFLSRWNNDETEVSCCGVLPSHQYSMCFIGDGKTRPCWALKTKQSKIQDWGGGVSSWDAGSRGWT